MRTYHTPARLLYHLIGRDCKGSRCLTHLAVRGHMGAPLELIDEIEAKERLRINECRKLGGSTKATKGLTPYRLPGPLEPLLSGPVALGFARIPIQPEV